MPNRPMLIFRAVWSAPAEADGGSRGGFPRCQSALGAFGLIAAVAGNFAHAQVSPHAGLPTPCPGVVACAGHSFDPLGTHSTLGYTGNTLTIQQNANSAVFNWQSFNISPGNTVVFNQPSTSSVALNRIFDPNVTQISGNLKANGQIYLVNPNGILFGSGANVNVGGLIASTQNVNDQRITGGLLSNPNVAVPAFTNDPAVVGTDLTASSGANPSIVVQSGASLYAAGKNLAGTVVSAGRVFLFAPTVDVAGSITVGGGGQVILASGSDVYLGSSTEPSLRGLLVEVSPATAGSGVTISPTGDISVARGNITLMGLAIHQAGTLAATSALDENGSISLIARAVNPVGASPNTGNDAGVLITPSETGSVDIASGSKTLVSLDPTDTKTLPLGDATSAALKSTITIQAGSITIGGNGAAGSTLLQANGGDITATARSASSSAAGKTYSIGDGSTLGASNANSTVVVGADVLMDVSGLQNVPVDGSLYYAYIPALTSNNLANAPFQRTGFLHLQPVYLNLNSAPSWINVSNLLAGIAGTQAQRNTVGGTIALQAEGSVTVKQGAVLNVSGGSTAVSASIGRVTNLITASGQVVPLNANASSTVQYIGYADNGTNTYVDSNEGIGFSTSWSVPSYSALGGYTQGANAGTLEIYAPSASLNGTLLGKATPGFNQRYTPPLGGQLLVGDSLVFNSNGNAVVDSLTLDSFAGFSRANIFLTGNATALGQSLTAAEADKAIIVDTSALSAGGFTRYNLTSDGIVQVTSDASLNLGPGGSFSARGNAVVVGASITAPGGSVSLSERPLTAVPLDTGTADEAAVRDDLNLVAPNAVVPRGAVVLGQGVTFGVAGNWTNDRLKPGPTLTSPIVLNGGSIAISGRSVDVSGASFDVSAGALANVNGVLSGGSAGSLSISGQYVAPGSNPYATAASGGLLLGSDFASRLSGFGVTKGGSLSIAAPSLLLGSGKAPTAGGASLDAGVGSRGFAAISLSGYDALDVATGLQFAPVVASLQLPPSLLTAPSAGNFDGLATALAPLPGVASPVKISLASPSLLDGSVITGLASSLSAGATGSFSVSAGLKVDVKGSLSAPGGSISLSLANTGLDDTLINDRSIVLGPGSVLDVSGTSLVQENALGLRSGSVLSGGTVALSAPLGAIEMASGAAIRAAGARDNVNVSTAAGEQLQTLATSGGIVSFTADTMLDVEGNFTGAGGSAGVPGGILSLALGGSQLSSSATNVSDLITLHITDTPPAFLSGAPLPTPVRPIGYVSPTAIGTSGFDRIWLQSADAIAFDQSTALSARASLVLSSQEISAAPGSNVSVRAPYVAIGGAAQLSAVTNGISNNPEAAATNGSARFDVQGQQIDLIGNLSLLGIGAADINSSGDVRLIGSPGTAVSVAAGPTVSGSLQFAGNLALTAAQVYPATQTQYSFTTTAAAADAANGNLVVYANPASGAAFAPISAGGALSFAVNNFTAYGKILAPLGSIDIAAQGTATLERGGILSVAGSGLVPYGTVLNGSEWTYNAPTNNSAVPIAPYILGSTAAGVTLGAKSISINGKTVNAMAGSTINISGGGDVLGTGFVAGPGGSYDYSQNFPQATASSQGSANPYFALIPLRGTAVAPYDPQIYTGLSLNGAVSAPGASFQFGETITIAAGSAIPAGSYTIMPARYALLPGAYAVAAVTTGNYANLLPGSSVEMPDGSTIVAGKLGDAWAQTASSTWSPFQVLTGSQFRSLSTFTDYLGSRFFATAAAASGQALPRLGPDAGALSFDAGAIALQSTLVTSATGRGPDIAIDAPVIVVSGTAAAQGTLTAGGSSAPQAEVDLSVLALSALKAESLVLGATDMRVDPLLPAAPTETVTLSNTTGSVTVEAAGGAGALSAGEIILAGASVTVAPGASLVALAGAKPQTTQLSLSGSGAFVYVGNAAQLPTQVAATGGAGIGSLSIGDGATISGSSVLFDAPQSQTYGTNLALHAGNVGIASSLVNFGQVPAGTTGLSLPDDVLRALGVGGSLRIASTNGFDIYGNATIGSIDAGGLPSLSQLKLIGPGIAAADASAQLSLAAGHVTLDNSAGGTLIPAGASGGGISISATATSTGDGSIAVSGLVGLSGFSGADLIAAGRPNGSAATQPGTGDLIFTGKPGSSSGLILSNQSGSPTANFNVTATRVTAQGGVDAKITVPGTFSLASSGNASPAEASNIGASLAINAAGPVSITGRIDLPAGVVDINSNSTVTLGSGSQIRVAGVTQNFGPHATADASAGSISITSTGGSVLFDTGSTIDLSGSGRLGDAGSLNLSATTGTLALQGTLALKPGSAARGAAIALDGLQMESLDTIAQAIEGGSGPQGVNSITVRARSGDLSLASGSTLKAGSIALEADGLNGPADGSITVSGTLDASGSSGGTVSLYANDFVTIGSGGAINVQGTHGDGGRVLLSSASTATGGGYAVQVATGSTINLSGATGNHDGELTLRASAIPSATSGGAIADVNIAPIAGNVVQANGNGAIIVDAVVTQSSTGAVTLDATALGNDATLLQDYMSAANRAAMLSRISQAGVVTSLRPELAVTSGGDITLTGLLDFASGLSSLTAGDGTFSWRYGGSTLGKSDPGFLTLRAAGNLNIDAPILDGFGVSSAANALNSAVWQTTGQSWSYTLTAGADLAAANPNQVVAGQAANLSVGSAYLEGSNSPSPISAVTVRTGTGSIALNASQDVILGNGPGTAANVVYTAGVGDIATAPTFAPLLTNLTGVGRPRNLLPVLTEGGGNLTIQAGRNVDGIDPAGNNGLGTSGNVNLDGSTQAVSEWLFRGGLDTTAAPSVWWVQFSQFQQGFGALGGGNLSVVAGGNIDRVSAVVPSVLYAVSGNIVQFNAGNLDVSAKGNIVQGLFYDQSGSASLRANAFLVNSADAPSYQNVRLAMGSGNLDLQAREASTISAPFNATSFIPASANVPANTNAIGKDYYTAEMMSYGPNTEFGVRVEGGSLEVSGASLQGSSSLAINSGSLYGLAVLQPPSMDMVAFNGDATSSTALAMFPSPVGQLNLLARGNLSGWEVTMLQANPSSLPQVTNPQDSVSDTTLLNLLSIPLVSADSLHSGDNQPAQIIASNGSISNSTFQIPKTTEIFATGNIGQNISIDVQNSNASSLSLINAGGSLDLSGTEIYGQINVGGLGAAEVVSGGAMNLGTDGLGIQAVANLENANLSAAGASLIVAAGSGLDSSGFAARPNYLNVVNQYLSHDAFAAAGSNSAALNAQVIAALSADPNLAGFAAQLQLAIQNRSTAAAPGSAFQAYLGNLQSTAPATLAVAGVKLSSAVQAVTSQQFVASANTDTFAPGYAAFYDLFPNLNNSAAAIQYFVKSNPFGNATNATTLRSEALAGLPADLISVINTGLADPGAVSNPASDFNKALAALDPNVLNTGSRQLLANVLDVAGTATDSLRASGSLTGAGSPFAKALTGFAQSYSPTTIAGLNDLNMGYNEVKVNGSGALAVLAPQGAVVVGQASPPVLDATAASKKSYQLGIFTIAGGDIIGMARNDFDVYQSRVFTIAGGDITLWSSLDSILAGNGAADIYVAAPPRLAINPNTGIAFLDFSSSVTGSGIGALLTEPDQRPSNINLIAPAGEVDAGEAGIRAQNGKIVLGTTIVVNPGLISGAHGVSGGAVVTAAAAPPPPAAGVSSADKVAGDAQREALASEAAKDQRVLARGRMQVVGEFLEFEDTCSEENSSASGCKDGNSRGSGTDRQ